MSYPEQNEILAYGALYALPANNRETHFARLAIGSAMAEIEARQEADTDELTGLMNRRAFVRNVQERIISGGVFGVLFADLTNFKWVNDRFDHTVGDRYLIRTSEVIQGALSLRDEDAAARIGGDEFAAAIDLTPRQNSSLTANERLAAVADRIGGEFETSLRAHSLDRFGLGVTVGFEVFDPGIHASAADVILGADQDMQIKKIEQHAIKGAYRPDSIG